MNCYLEEIWGNNFKKSLEGYDMPVEFCHFPIQTPENLIIHYSDWKNGLDEIYNQGKINENTIVIAHSLGTIAFVKWLSEKNIKVNTFISLAGVGGLVDKKEAGIKASIKRTVMNSFGKDFMPSDDDFKKFKENVKIRHSFYSDNDHLFTEETLKSFAGKIDANTTVTKGQGHYSRTLNIKYVPYLRNVIKQYHPDLFSRNLNKEM